VRTCILTLFTTIAKCTNKGGDATWLK
jgi:hypothetical protein